MNTEEMFQIGSNNTNETAKVAAAVARNLRGGETIELISDVGAGKTTFVKSLVAELGSTDHVSSPSFMISKEYTAPTMRIVHFDFYRLQDAGSIAYALQEAVLDDKTLCIVEWPGAVQNVLPKNRVTIRIQKDPDVETKRLFECSAPASLAYCLKGIKDALLSN